MVPPLIPFSIINNISTIVNNSIFTFVFFKKNKLVMLIQVQIRNLLLKFSNISASNNVSL